MDSEATKTESLYDFLAWLHVNRTRILVVTAGVALVASVAAFVAWNKRHQDEVANEALSDIRLSGNPNTPVPPGTAEAFLKVANAYPNSTAGSRALLFAATTFFDLEKYAEAKTFFEKFSHDYPDSPWRAQADLGIAVCLDSPKQSQAAADKYDEIIKRYPNEPAADLARLELARWHDQQNKPEAALRLYQELAKANPYSSLGSEAGVQRQQILEKHPQLEQTNTAATPQPTMVVTPQPAATNAASTNAPRLTKTNPPTLKIPPPPKK